MIRPSTHYNVFRKMSRQGRKAGSKACNICHKNFKCQSKFILFCDACKESSARYRYGDWLPELEATYAI